MIGNRAEFEASAENVVAHGHLGFRDFSNYGIGAANISQIMLEPEVNSRSHTSEHISRDFSLRSRDFPYVRRRGFPFLRSDVLF